MPSEVLIALLGFLGAIASGIFAWVKISAAAKNQMALQRLTHEQEQDKERDAHKRALEEQANKSLEMAQNQLAQTARKYSEQLDSQMAQNRDLMAQIGIRDKREDDLVQAKEDVIRQLLDERELKSHVEGELEAQVKVNNELRDTIRDLLSTVESAQDRLEKAARQEGQLSAELGIFRQQLNDMSDTVNSLKADLMETRRQKDHLAAEVAQYKLKETEWQSYRQEWQQEKQDLLKEVEKLTAQVNSLEEKIESLSTQKEITS